MAHRAREDSARDPPRTDALLDRHVLGVMKHSRFLPRSSLPPPRCLLPSSPPPSPPRQSVLSPLLTIHPTPTRLPHSLSCSPMTHLPPFPPCSNNPHSSPPK